MRKSYLLVFRSQLRMARCRSGASAAPIPSSRRPSTLQQYCQKLFLQISPLISSMGYKDFHPCLPSVHLRYMRIGYDSTVHRVLYGNDTCYVYKTEMQGHKKCFRTVKPLFSPRVRCITERKTRVWQAVEVEGVHDYEVGRVKDGSAVALKDVWLDDKSETEKQILDNIFERLQKVKEEDYEWAYDELKGYLKHLLEPGRYKNHFMEIKNHICHLHFLLRVCSSPYRMNQRAHPRTC